MGNDYRSRESDGGGWYYSDDNRYIPQRIVEKEQRRRERVGAARRRTLPRPRPYGQTDRGPVPWTNPEHLLPDDPKACTPESADARHNRVAGMVFAVSFVLLVVFVIIAVIMFLYARV